MADAIQLPARAFVTLQIEVREAAVDLRINDIPIFSERRPGNVAVELPASHAILDGENRVSLHATPLPEEDAFAECARVQATVFVREVGKPRDTRQMLTGINYHPTAKPQASAKPTPGAPTDPTTALSPGGGEPIERTDAGGGAVLLRRAFALRAPFPRWAWLAGTRIEPDERTMSSLLDEYMHLQRALDQSDERTVRGMTAVRARELAAAYHLGDEEAGHRKLGILRRLDDRRRKLDKFRRAGMHMEVYGEGRLARIVDEDGDGPIAFLIGSGGEVAEYVKAGYFRDERGRWIMVH